MYYLHKQSFNFSGNKIYLNIPAPLKDFHALYVFMYAFILTREIRQAPILPLNPN
jgi:hypothetical protein